MTQAKEIARRRIEERREVWITLIRYHGRFPRPQVPGDVLLDLEAAGLVWVSNSRWVRPTEENER